MTQETPRATQSDQKAGFERFSSAPSRNSQGSSGTDTEDGEGPGGVAVVVA